MRTRGTFSWAGLVLGLAALAGCGSQGSEGPGAGDGGGARCQAFLSGLRAAPDAGAIASIGLDDAGFDCIALLLTDDAGARTSFSLTPVGDLPDGVTSVSAVFVRGGSAPDGGATLGLGDFVQAGASATLRDGLAFGLQKASGVQTGAATLALPFVADAGSPAAGGRRTEVHGTLDATLPYLFGSRPDGGPFDAGNTVKLRAEF